jgi:hypothetical protein
MFWVLVTSRVGTYSDKAHWQVGDGDQGQDSDVFALFDSCSAFFQARHVLIYARDGRNLDLISLKILDVVGI